MNESIFKTRALRKQVAPLWLMLSLSFLWSEASTAGIEMIDFTQANEHTNWTVTNDNVMGGISTGGVIYSGGMSQFKGELSLENNGGFSSINRSIESLRSEADNVELTFVGDGRTYQLRFTTWKGGYRTNYKHNFETIKGEQLKKVFQLKDFQAVFRGRLLSGAPRLEAQDIKQIGFLIADKQPLPFELNLIQVQFKTSQETE
ncbi:CIA30 family protein [Vibrio crassostreae]|uniref:CIA30 family protein n=1 Tax=Vibrio crassostreae TaxID=246167 RepID=UPI000632736E|nr:CIA30 family protein [Vibrio crassostreae]TCT55251.1 complex I intermediate-associated protein 30 (CIA30) [Vibrio crassostreae]TCT68141.1 complex I intermediate-associated protein 30 (CIA30) [Vibrio crassostreae]TCT79482.1 complex I intermediate-associated protein 30 (CIA30) [Vibrio crassostreae]TCT98164.1 complex I intermediate-associated protein 30 (CIA30) [Vibrio crassostreae]CAK1854804.1 NADH dehydrogenase (ubiquinone) 1 alpha subcomplex assembly factor 1 [Vibrio crassostreae]